jgi:hypothetical protein
VIDEKEKGLGVTHFLFYRLAASDALKALENNKRGKEV